MCCLSNNLFALGGDHPSGQPVYLHKAPKAVNDLVNKENRFHGYFVNAEDRFFYSGSTEDFESFLVEYAALKGVAGHRLIIHSGKGVANSPWEDKDAEVKHCDWMLFTGPVSWAAEHRDIYRDHGHSPKKNSDNEYVVEVHIWTEGNVDLDKLSIPKRIKVDHATDEESTKKTPESGGKN
jgi:hypothetical protein